MKCFCSVCMSFFFETIERSWDFWYSSGTVYHWRIRVRVGGGGGLGVGPTNFFRLHHRRCVIVCLHAVCGKKSCQLIIGFYQLWGWCAPLLGNPGSATAVGWKLQLSILLDMPTPRRGGEGVGSMADPGGRQHTNLPNFPKTAWNWKNLDPQGGASLAPPLDPPLGVETLKLNSSKETFLIIFLKLKSFLGHPKEN